jgi:molybdenum cofactor cytidylyltransferase
MRFGHTMKSSAAVILAAGASVRLGEPKQLVTLAGQRLLERAVTIAEHAGCYPVVVVLGANAAQIRARCSLASAQIVINAAWSEGMATSIRGGIAALADAEATILMTCDQPAVTSEHLRRLIELCETAPIASSYGATLGVPACFPASCFRALLQLEGDAGARTMLEAAQSVELPGGELDIDTPGALATARELYENSKG